MSEFSSPGEETLNEVQYIRELKLAAGIGLLDITENNDELDTEDIDDECNDVGEIKVPIINSVGSESISATPSSYNIKDLLEKYRKPDQWLDSKVYTRLLLPEEFVVKEALVWKRRGWSFKNRWLVLTNKPRLFYTTPTGHYKGAIPWSMTEPIEISMVDKSHFDIRVHSSSRIYHFNDKSQGGGSQEWVEVINEISDCWKSYLLENAPEQIRKKGMGRR